MRPDEQIQAVRLLRDGVATASGGGIDGRLVLLAVGVLAGLGVLVGAWFVWRRRAGDPSVRAYKRLSRALQLTRAEQAVLGELGSKEVKPVALLLSHHAFVRAANQAGGSERVKTNAVAALHAKVFGGEA